MLWFPEDVFMISAIRETRDIAANVDGWLEDCEGELLFELAKGCEGRGAIVEVGSWKGKSTLWLAKGSMSGNRVKVLAIDPHTGSEEHHKAFGKVWTFDAFNETIASAGLQSVVFPLVKTSRDAAVDFEEPVELIFIDGAHDYESVKADFELWFPKVIEGGIMAFHDTTYGEGPLRVVEENLYTSRNFSIVHLVGSITYARKVNRNSKKVRIRNLSAMYLRRTPEPVRHLLPKPLKSLARKIVAAAGTS